MGRKYQVISADGHVEVPADTWSKRVPAKYRDVAPKLVVHDDKSEWWHMAQFERENSGNLVCDLDYDKFAPGTGRTYHNPDGTLRPGTGNASQRLREQDLDGIDAEILYPPVYAGSLLRQMIPIDKEAYLSIVRAYNDFLAEEYCAVAPDRLVGNAMMPETGIEDALTELRRIRKKGLKAISLSMWPNGGPAYKPEDERWFAESIDLDGKISPHGAFGGPMSMMAAPNPKVQTGPGPNGVVMGRAPGGAADSMGMLIINGVFDRLPKLQIYYAETQAGWLPHHLNWADEFYQRWYPYHDVKLKKIPSQYYRDHAKFSFISDRLAMKYRYYIGLDLLMWGSDFPHSVGTMPHSRDFLKEYFGGIPEAEKRQVLVENPAKFFGLDVDKDLTPTPT